MADGEDMAMEDKQLQAAVPATHEHRELTLAAKARSPKEAADLLAEYPVNVIAASHTRYGF